MEATAPTVGWGRLVKEPDSGKQHPLWGGDGRLMDLTEATAPTVGWGRLVNGPDGVHSTHCAQRGGESWLKDLTEATAPTVTSEVGKAG